MRRIVRGVLWIVKGVLLAIALGALFLWPWSYWLPGGLWVSRYTLGDNRVDHVDFEVGREGVNPCPIRGDNLVSMCQPITPRSNRRVQYPILSSQRGIRSFGCITQRFGRAVRSFGCIIRS